MSVRKFLEEQEHFLLDPRAAFSDRSKGRPVPQERDEDEVRTC